MVFFFLTRSGGLLYRDQFICYVNLPKVKIRWTKLLRIKLNAKNRAHPSSFIKWPPHFKAIFLKFLNVILLWPPPTPSNNLRKSFHLYINPTPLTIKYGRVSILETMVFNDIKYRWVHKELSASLRRSLRRMGVCFRFFSSWIKKCILEKFWWKFIWRKKSA